MNAVVTAVSRSAKHTLVNSVTTQGVDLLGPPAGARLWFGGAAICRGDRPAQPVRSADRIQPGIEITVIYIDRDRDERHIISAWRSEPHERRYFWDHLED